jgi:hypothetical protein
VTDAKRGALRPDWKLLPAVPHADLSAPFDGEPYLIWKPDERMVGEYMMLAYWDHDHFSGEPGWVPVGGHNRQGYVSEVTGTRQGYPTHWAEQPERPER